MLTDRSHPDLDYDLSHDGASRFFSSIKDVGKKTAGTRPTFGSLTG